MDYRRSLLSRSVMERYREETGCISMPRNNENLKLGKEKRRGRACGFYSYISSSSSVLAAGLLPDSHPSPRSSRGLGLMLAPCSACCIVSAELRVSAGVAFAVGFSSVCCNKARLGAEAGVTD